MSSPENPPYPFKDLEDIVVNKIGVSENLFVITIRDQDKWNNRLERLMSLFGKMIFEEYERQEFSPQDSGVQERALKQLELTFKGANKVYVVYRQAEVIGFCSLEFYRDDQTVGIIRDILVDKNERGKGIGEKLYKAVFTEGNFSSIVGYSKTPAAVHTRLKLASQYGYSGFFGDMANTKDVKRLQDLMLNYMEKEEILSQQVAPPGFAFLKGRNILPPLKEDDIRFPQDDSLYPVFQKLLKIQASDSCGETAVGILITMRFSP